MNKTENTNKYSDQDEDTLDTLVLVAEDCLTAHAWISSGSGLWDIFEPLFLGINMPLVRLGNDLKYILSSEFLASVSFVRCQGNAFAS